MVCCVVGCPCSNYVETEPEQPVEETEQQPPWMPTETSFGTVCNCGAGDGAIAHHHECPVASVTFWPVPLEDAPKQLCTCGAKANQCHQFDCPLSLSEKLKAELSQTEILHPQPVRFIQITANSQILHALDRDGEVWAFDFYRSNPTWYKLPVPVKE